MSGCIGCQFEAAYRSQLARVTTSTMDEQARSIGDGMCAGFALARRYVWEGVDLDLALMEACDRHQEILLKSRPT